MTGKRRTLLFSKVKEKLNFKNFVRKINKKLHAIDASRCASKNFQEKF